MEAFTTTELEGPLYWSLTTERAWNLTLVSGVTFFKGWEEPRLVKLKLNTYGAVVVETVAASLTSMDCSKRRPLDWQLGV